jgi:hypothetical protein
MVGLTRIADDLVDHFGRQGSASHLGELIERPDTRITIGLFQGPLEIVIDPFVLAPTGTRNDPDHPAKPGRPCIDDAFIPYPHTGRLEVDISIVIDRGRHVELRIR